MKNFVKRFISIITLSLVLAFSFGSTAEAGGERMEFFNFEHTVFKMDAGSVKEIRVIAYYDYTYYLGPHTSAATYMECTFNSGTENVRIHVGPDETVKNLFIHFYVDDDKIESTDVHDCIEIYVQNIDPAAVEKVNAHNAEIEALRNYPGNNAEFNALYYYYNYKDLQNAFGMDADKLLNHYNTFGKNEKRIANRLVTWWG